MTASQILGWILIFLGVLSYVWALIAFIRSQKKEVQRGLVGFTDRDLKAVAEILDKIAELLANFGKLSIPVQWALLGLGNIGLGAYLLATQPF